MKDDFFIEKTKKEMDTLMDEIVGFSRISFYRKTHFSPPVDIYEANNRFVIITDVAGIDKKLINITVSDDILIIKGERKRTNAIDENLCYYHMEIEYGPFERRIRIPRNIDMDNMDIEYDNGLLKIEIPLITKQVRKIEIE
ncbi:MAG: Hsp20/alpha crystallin family protein [bacterium]